MLWLLRTIERLSRWHALVFIALSFGVGQLLNRSWPLDNLLTYQLLFTLAVVYAFFEIKRFLNSVGDFRIMTASHPNKEDGDYIYMLSHSYWYGGALLVVGGLFIYSTVELSYVTFDPTGIYALVMITLVMLSAVLGQTFYIYYILLLRRIISGQKFKYNFYLPARTDWVQLLAKVGTRLSNAFFLLGFIYTAVYYLNVKDGYVKLSFSPLQIDLSTPNDIVFLVSWFALFAIVIVTFPLYAWLQSRYMNAIVRKLKDVAIEEINFLITESNIRQEKDVDTEVKYYRLMLDIDGSATSPQERLKIIPIVATASSIAVHVIKISESF